ncbi:MAG TPA: hydrogenase maturation protease [Verrucomicrobiota bacterium]|nr:hydrogenase maturation protease [Verrucomicrobiota bacterium]HNU49688.1 hydrogenase maturation protease [Verrucomicrobiota bacterium]
MQLVIGYGNEMRGDDAIGPRVARAVEALNLPNVSTRVVFQLTPELAEPLARASRAVFVDAALGGPAGSIDVRPLEPLDLRTPLGHLAQPPSLLALAQAVFGHAPPAWIVRIFGTTFDLGLAPSRDAEQAALAAVDAVVSLLSQPLNTHDDPHPHPHDPREGAPR